jgi:hypothetical protein
MATVKRIKPVVRLSPHAGRSFDIPAVASDDPKSLAECLEVSRRQGRRGEVAFWRQRLTTTMACRRAEAGDRTAARRLAWRETIVAVRSEMKNLLWRFEALEGEITRIIRRGQPCAWCSQVLERRCQSRDEVVTAMTGIMEKVVTWREYRRREEATAKGDHGRVLTARDADAWLRRQLAGLKEGV